VDGPAPAAGVEADPDPPALLAETKGIRASCTALRSSSLVAEVNVNISPPVGMSSRKASLSWVFFASALLANMSESVSTNAPEYEHSRLGLQSGSVTPMRARSHVGTRSPADPSETKLTTPALTDNP
jgi:hypothetical protein